MPLSKTALFAALREGFAGAAQDAGFLLVPLGSVDPRSPLAQARPCAILADLDLCTDEDWRALEAWRGLGHFIGVGGGESLALRLRATQCGCIAFLDGVGEVGATLAVLSEITGAVGGQSVAGAGKILLVDANPVSATSACQLLDQAGFTVTCLADTTRLLATLSTRQWDLLILQPGPSLADAAAIVQTLGADRQHAGISVLLLPAAGEGRPFTAAELVPAVTERILASRRLVGAMYRDLVTGGCRRPYFEMRLDEEINRATRQGTTISLALLSLYDFQAIAERQGPEASRRLVGNLVRVVISNARRTDLVCHLGGGRVAVMLPAATCEQAVVLLETMRMGFGAFLHREGAAPDSVSFGAGVADLRQGRTRSQMFEAAGRALATARDEDGNCIAVAEAI